VTAVTPAACRGSLRAGDRRHRPPVVRALASGWRKEVDVIGREMAQMHIDDMVRAAERERLGRQVRRPGGRQSTLRRVAIAVAAAVMWPVRH
jgi:hypothetical protein